MAPARQEEIWRAAPTSCSHVSGLLMQPDRLLALMEAANRWLSSGRYRDHCQWDFL